MKTRFNYDEQHSKHRKHVLETSPERLQEERFSFLQMFHAKYPDYAMELNKAISHDLVLEYIKKNGIPKDEYRLYKMLACDFDKLEDADCYRCRILIKDIESGANRILTALSVPKKPIKNGNVDIDKVVDLFMLDGLVKRSKGNVCDCYGIEISLRTINGVPMLPIASDAVVKNIKSKIKKD